MKTNQVTEDWGFGPGDVSPTFRKEKGVQIIMEPVIQSRMSM